MAVVTSVNFSIVVPVPDQVSTGVIPNYTEYGNMPNQWLRKCGGHDYGNERELYKNLLTEAWNKHGVCMEYYVTTYDTSYDKVWGEDCNRRFVRRFDFMGRYTLPDENKMWTTFEIEGLDQFPVYISKKHFKEASTYGESGQTGNNGKSKYAAYIPQQGDIIKADYNDHLYEIVEVKEEAMMFLQSKDYVWECQVKVYREEHVEIGTGVDISASDIIDLINQDASADAFNVRLDASAEYEDIKYQVKSCQISNDPFNNI
jgi:hypothetical protein